MDILLNTTQKLVNYQQNPSAFGITEIKENKSFDFFEFFLESSISNTSKANPNNIDYLLYDDEDEDFDDDDDIDEEDDDDWDDDEFDDDDEDFDDDDWDEDFDDDDDEFDDDDWDDDDDEEWEEEPEDSIMKLQDFTIN